MGVVSANLACEYLDDAGHYWNEVVSIHAVDVGVTTPDATGQSILDTERGFVQDVHNALAAAAIHDQRWAGLKALVSRDEAAATALWDRGGVTVADAVNKAVGTDEDTVHGDCATARAELMTTASTRNVPPQVKS